MRAFVAPQDRVIVVGSCPPAPRGSRRPGPTPGERRVVLGAGLPAPRTIPTGRRRRTVITPAPPVFPGAEVEGFAEPERAPWRDTADGEHRTGDEPGAHGDRVERGTDSGTERAEEGSADQAGHSAEAESGTERTDRSGYAAEARAERAERNNHGAENESGSEYDAADLVPDHDEPRRLTVRQERVAPRRATRETDDLDIEYRALQIARDREAEDRTLAGIAELLDA